MPSQEKGNPGPYSQRGQAYRSGSTISIEVLEGADEGPLTRVVHDHYLITLDRTPASAPHLVLRVRTYNLHYGVSHFDTGSVNLSPE